MTFAASTFWWVAAGAAVAVELATGTFYLLMIALGLAAAAIASHVGLAAAGQVVVAALVGGGATAVWHLRRARSPRAAAACENRDVNLDIGAHVHVHAWSADGSTRVAYRGTSWPARLQPGSAAAGGVHTVVAVEGNWLVLAPTTRPAPSASPPARPLVS